MTLKQAWAKTIKKWSTKNQKLNFFTRGGNCGFCNLFNNEETIINNDCIGCPINQKDKPAHYCKSFPAYQKFYRIYKDDDFTGDEAADEVTRIEGLNFLLALKKECKKKRGKCCCCKVM